jgi:hypothetical protein
VLTKWDLLREHDLADIVARLDRYPAFRGLRTMQRLRLIPVAAFGLNSYLTKTPEGTVKKNPDQAWDPFHPSLPVACALTDIVAADLKRIEAAKPRPGHRVLNVATSPVSPVFRTLLVGLGLTAVAAHPLHALTIKAGWALAVKRGLDIDLEIPLTDIVEILTRVISLRPGQSAQDLLLRVPDRGTDPGVKAATLHTLAYCAQLTRSLEQQFPASDLTLQQPR